jgi:eukaryotic-like serine/threonine-protein kinase
VQTIGKYHIVRELGHGGMGTVYEAVDPLIRRKVALKTMIPELAETAELRARFLREAQAAGGLQHRNIVTVYDLGEDKGRPYIAMEFIEGTDLEKIIQSREALPIEWKLDVLAQICEGLSHAHRNGIVHRDVKPGNVRVTAQGDVKIMDFGVASLQSSNLTKSGGMLGTVHYMSPEQVDGRKVDHRADVFAVGAIAYELLSSRKPFDGESLTGVMYKIMHEDPDSGLIPASDYSPGLERIVMKAMARSVDERYQSLDEMHEELAVLVRETAGRLGAGGEAPAAKAGGGKPVGEEPGVSAGRKAASDEAARLTAQGRQALAAGQVEQAGACAQQALALAADHADAKALALDAESEGLRRRVEQEMGDIRAEMEEARTSGQLQRALGLCRKLLDLDPDDTGLRAVESQIQTTIQEKEVEQLSSQALAYAADGDLELAQKIATRVERIAPQSPTFLKLKLYLDEEGRFRRAEALMAQAREHLAQGELEEARAAAEKALLEDADHALAREIRDRASEVLARQGGALRAIPLDQDTGPLPIVLATTGADTEPVAAFVEVDPPTDPDLRLPVVAPAPPPAPASPQTPAIIFDADPVEPEPILIPDLEPPPVVAAPPPPAPAPAREPAPAPAPAPVAAPVAAREPAPVAAAPKAPARTPSPFAPRPAPVTKAMAPKPAPAPAAPVKPPAPAVSAPAPTPAALKAPPLVKASPPPAPEAKPAPVAPPPAAATPAPVAAAPPAVAPPVAAAPPSEAKRKGEAEALTSAALNHFVQNNYGKARKAVEKALALEPENKKARELMKILGALG